MSVLSQVITFLRTFCPSSQPLLLALSGGPDSLCLFYCLLAYRSQYQVPFHVAHVDHGWRSESQAEAQALKRLSLSYEVPFHLKTLNPSLVEGNLEAACREERYNYFAILGQSYPFQGVLTGHHRDDQAETVFKRILEGSNWSYWAGLKPESSIYGIRVLRPLLQISKQEIQQDLEERKVVAFDDSTNHHLRFLRVRLRKEIFPWLNHTFGKQVQMNFIKISEDSQELVEYFEDHLAPYLKGVVRGPWGLHLNLQEKTPSHIVEIKFLIRWLCRMLGFFCSRAILNQAARSLQRGEANQLFEINSHQIWIDRKQLFILSKLLPKGEDVYLKVESGIQYLRNWKLEIKEDQYSSLNSITSWREGWQGKMRGYLLREDLTNYTIGFKSLFNQWAINQIKVKKHWSQAKVPAFLYSYFPLIWQDSQICYEFLTGKFLRPLQEGTPCWRITLSRDDVEDKKRDL